MHNRLSLTALFMSEWDENTLGELISNKILDYDNYTLSGKGALIFRIVCLKSSDALLKRNT